MRVTQVTQEENYLVLFHSSQGVLAWRSGRGRGKGRRDGVGAKRVEEENRGWKEEKNGRESRREGRKEGRCES